MPHVLLLLVVLMLAGCGDPQRPELASSVGCSTHLECLGSERCVEGVCRALPTGDGAEDPAVQDDPVEDPVVEEEPVEDPVVEDDPVIENDPVIEDDPVVEDDPVEDPIVEEDPVVEDDPIVEDDPVVEDDPAVEEDPVVEDDPVEDPVTGPYDWASGDCVPAYTEAQAVALPRMASTTASLGVDVSGRLCDGDSREMYLQTEVFRGDPVISILTYEGDRDIDLSLRNGLSSTYKGFGVGYGQTFEIGSTLAPQEGDADPLDTETFLKVRAFATLPAAGVPFRLQVRSGLPCTSDAGCTGDDACLRAYWSPRQDSQGNNRRMRSTELALPGACAMPLKTACDDPDAANLEQLGNDRQSAAKVVTFNPAGFAPNDGQTCQFDEDWYRVTMPTTGDVAIELWNNDGDQAPASFLVSAYDEDGRPLADMGYEDVAAGSRQADLVIPDKASGSTIYVRIVGLSANTSGAYYLDFEVAPGGCTGDSVCADNPDAARYGRTQCVNNACACPAGGCFGG